MQHTIYYITKVAESVIEINKSLQFSLIPGIQIYDDRGTGTNNLNDSHMMPIITPLATNQLFK